MPPSHHSSSHHSSHHSSSRSHSSHSHSSHSSSHHTSSYRGSSSSRNSYSGSRRTAPAAPRIPKRTRVNQPYGWKGVSGSTVHYHLENHDYDYYPDTWTTDDGKLFREGYYDENGNYFPNILAFGAATMLKCEYCGNKMLYTMKEGELPQCDKCGAQFDIEIKDKVVDDDLPEVKKSGEKWDWFFITLGLLFVLFWFAVIVGAFFLIGRTVYTAVRNPDSSAVSAESRTIYVEEIGRTCTLDGEDWYDAVSDVWFWFNDEVEPYQWQYWAEGISSDFGDYGWMEYDMAEGTWYIEASEGNWIPLPAEYDTSRLWHMTDEYTDPFEE